MQTLKTIEARLIPSERIPTSDKNPDPIAFASEDARQFILHLSVASTQLCKVLNDQIRQHSEFETWKKNSSIPGEVLKEEWNTIRSKPPYEEIPERFNRSAWLRIKDIYTGWFERQSKPLARLNGLNRWLSVVKSDHQLVEISECQLEEIQARANQILAEAELRLKKAKQSIDDVKSEASKKLAIAAPKQVISAGNQAVDEQKKSTEGNHNLTNELFKIYFSLVERNSSPLDQCAIIHLLKNGCKIASKPEDPKKFAATCHEKRKEAQRIEKQLNARIPEVRDLGEEASKALSDGVQIVTLDDAEFSAQLARLQRKANPLPYPVLFYSSDDIEWYLIKRENQVTQKIEERIFVKFKGLNTYLRKQLKKQSEKLKLKKEYVFEICCDRRQLPIFRIFLSDWQTYTKNRKHYAVTAFAFQSAALIWRQSVENGVSELQPYLTCTVDYRELTVEGAESVRADNVAKLSKKIANYEAKQESGEKLTENQQKDLKKSKSQLIALNNPYSRPSKPPYKGNPNIIVGVTFSYEQVANVAVVDCSTQKVIAYRSIRQLLGKEYEMLSAYRLEQRRNANERHKQQKRGKVSTLSEANKGKHIDRLTAKAIVEVVQEFNASKLALPKLTGVKERLQSRLEAKAEWKHPGDRDKQKKYRKQYKINNHRWSYGRLIQCIEDRAGKVGVPIEQVHQPAKGDLKEKAVQIAWLTYRICEDGAT